MGVNYKGLLNGNLDPIQVAKVLQRIYGGERYSIEISDDDFCNYYIDFIENMNPEVKAMRPWNRKGHIIHRHMQFLTNGSCAHDYVDITTQPMTIVSLSHYGQCREIINCLLDYYGGWVMDETANEGWIEWSKVTQSV